MCIRDSLQAQGDPVPVHGERQYAQDRAGGQRLDQAQQEGDEFGVVVEEVCEHPGLERRERVGAGRVELFEADVRAALRGLEDGAAEFHAGGVGAFVRVGGEQPAQDRDAGAHPVPYGGGGDVGELQPDRRPVLAVAAGLAGVQVQPAHRVRPVEVADLAAQPVGDHGHGVCGDQDRPDPLGVGGPAGGRGGGGSTGHAHADLHRPGRVT